MFDSAPMERLYAPLVACWWLGMVTYFHWWGSAGIIAEPQRRHLRLVTDNGKLIERL